MSKPIYKVHIAWDLTHRGSHFTWSIQPRAPWGWWASIVFLLILPIHSIYIETLHHASLSMQNFALTFRFPPGLCYRVRSAVKPSRSLAGLKGLWEPRRHQHGLPPNLVCGKKSCDVLAPLMCTPHLLYTHTHALSTMNHILISHLRLSFIYPLCFDPLVAVSNEI